MEDETVIIVAAVVAIVVVESIALMNGVNGVLLRVVVATLAGLGGYSVHTQIHKL